MIKWITVEVTTVLTSDHLRRQGRALCHGPELGPGNVRVDGGQLAEGCEPAVRARLHPVTNQLERIQGGKEEKDFKAQTRPPRGRGGTLGFLQEGLSSLPFLPHA